MHLIFSRWNVVNGIDGETCTDWKTGDDELWCTSVKVPGNLLLI